MKCKAITRRKFPCSRHSVKEEEYCDIHLRRFKKHGITELQECIICTDIITKNPNLSCKHIIHRKCIIRDAISQNRKVAQCPLCRREMPEIWNNPNWRPTVYPLSPDDIPLGGRLYILNQGQIPISFENEIIGIYDVLLRMIRAEDQSLPLDNVLNVLRSLNLAAYNYS